MNQFNQEKSYCKSNKNCCFNILKCVGPTGPTGPQGIQGESGPTGPAGTSGILNFADCLMRQQLHLEQMLASLKMDQIAAQVLQELVLVHLI